MKYSNGSPDWGVKTRFTEFRGSKTSGEIYREFLRRSVPGFFSAPDSMMRYIFWMDRPIRGRTAVTSLAPEATMDDG
jgi:hypothetical protein